MFPVRGDIRLVDGNETLVFTGSQKAISWLNKIFSSMHESSLPNQLQKYARRSSSAPSRTLVASSGTTSPREFSPEPDSVVVKSLPAKVTRPVSREKSPRHSPRAGPKKGRAWGSPPTSPSARDHAPSLSRQKKSFLRGRRPATSSPRDSTISSRAKSCERIVRPKSSGILAPSSASSSPQKRKIMALSLPKSGSTTVPRTTTAVHGTDMSPTTPQRFSITPRRVRAQEKPSAIATNSSWDSPSPEGARVSPTTQVFTGGSRGRPPPLPSTDAGKELLCEPRPFRKYERPINHERMKTLSTSPFSPLSRMTISSANRRRPPTSTAALLRRFGTSAKLSSIPELLMQHQRPGTPIRPLSPQPIEHKRPWDYTESPTDSTPPEVDRSTVTSPITPTRDSTALTFAVVTPRPPRSPPPRSPLQASAAATARPMTPIASDFLRSPKAGTMTPDEESWRRLLSTPPPANKTFFKNPLYNKALVERKPSTALRSLAHPGGEMIIESTLKQFSSATRKFISRALTRIGKVDNHLTTVICQ